MEEVIHVKFKDYKPNIKMSELDEAFLNMKLGDRASALPGESAEPNVSRQADDTREEKRESNGSNRLAEDIKTRTFYKKRLIALIS